MTTPFSKSLLLSVVVAPLVVGLFACSDAPGPSGTNGGDETNSTAGNHLDPWPVDDACIDDETLCGDECVETDVDPRHCGECDESCPQGHLCRDGECVTHEGDCPGEVCTGFTYCEGETGMCRPGCHEDAQCTGGRICDTDQNSCVCPGDQRICGGACFAPDDPDACGADCLDCPDGGGTGTDQCIDGQCRLQCEEDRRECDKRCVECPGGATETVCEAGECIADECPAGERVCDGVCVECPAEATETDCENGQCIATACQGDDQRACNGDCVDCPGDAETTDCDGDQCIATSCVDDGQRACNGTCVDCPGDADGTTCDGDQCIATSCVDDDQRACDGSCVDCPDGLNPQCDGAECVTDPCPDDSFECSEYGCCQWKAESVKSLDSLGRASRISTDGNIPRVIIPQGSHISASELEFGTSNGGDWSFETILPTEGVSTFIPTSVTGSSSPYLFYLQDTSGNVDGNIRGLYQSGGDWFDVKIGDAQTQSIPFNTTSVDGDNYLVYLAEGEDLVVAEETGPPGSDWFSTEVVASNLASTGAHADMVADDDGNIHFAAIAGSRWGADLIYGTNQSGQWETQFIDYDIQYPGLIYERRIVSIDVGDQPVISYFDSGDSGLHIYEYDGTNWQQTPDIVQGDDIREVLLQFDNNTPHIMYRHDDELYHARRFDDQWHLQSVDEIPVDEEVHASPYLDDGQLMALVVTTDDLYLLSTVSY